jgi:hypothetical protein
VTPDASDEEAAWRDLVAQYAAPTTADGTPVPWPTREDLPGAAASADVTDLDAGGPDTADLDPPDLGATDPDTGATDPDTGAADPDTGAADLDTGAADLDADAADLDADADAADGDEPEPGDAPTAPSANPIPGVIPAPPQLRIIRPAVPVPIPADDDDEHFVPPIPPPLPRLDPITKGAWVALFGGPAYLLIAVMVDWQVPGWAAFCAVAAFIGGFATLVVHTGERPPRDSGPDDGAVV